MGQGENDPVFLHLSIYFLLFWIVSDFWEKNLWKFGALQEISQPEGSRRPAGVVQGS